MADLAKATQGNTISALLARPEIQHQIGLALPKHMTPERLLRIALTEVRRQPKLAECTQESLLGAVFQCAQLGMEPGGALGHAYLVPYKREVQFILGYRGMIDLARRSGQIRSIEAHCVYEGDKFDCTLGLESNLVHEPDWDNPNRSDTKKITFAYAVAHLADGGREFEVMSRRELDETKRRSKSNGGPWSTDYAAMCRKTVVRRLFKWLPLSVELSQACANDEAPEVGRRQETAIDHVIAPVEEAVDEVRVEAVPSVVTVSADQLEQLDRATKMRLTPAGRVAFQVAFDCQSGLKDMPAERFDDAMSRLADNQKVDEWNGQAQAEAA